jgi:hypothetical protein
VLDPESGGYDFENLTLKAGDVLELMFLEDGDDDNLGLRAERFAGTTTDHPDSDGDGIKDGDEIIGYDLTIDYGLEIGIQTSRISSNPVLADTDGDGVSDFDEINPANQDTWLTNPLSADTDNDEISDQFDPEPSLFNSIQLIDLVLDKNADAANPSPTLSFDLPAIDTAEVDVTYEIYRETVNIGEAFACSDDLSCADYDTISPSISATSVSHTDTSVSGLNKNHRYRIYITVDGSPRILVATETVDTASDLYRVTVNFDALYVDLCVDDYTVLDTGFGDIVIIDERECEFYWKLYVYDLYNTVKAQNYDGYNLSTIKGAATSGSKLGDNLNMTESYTFDLPRLNNSCVMIRAYLYEKDQPNNATTAGDHSSLGLSGHICGDNLLSYSNNASPIMLNRVSSIVDGGVTYQQAYITKMYFGITSEVILAP